MVEDVWEIAFGAAVVLMLKKKYPAEIFSELHILCDCIDQKIVNQVKILKFFRVSHTLSSLFCGRKVMVKHEVVCFPLRPLANSFIPREKCWRMPVDSYLFNISTDFLCQTNRQMIYFFVCIDFTQIVRKV